MPALREPSVELIEGRKTLVVKRRPPLQQRLHQLLDALFAVTYRADVRPTGASTQCDVLREHRWRLLAKGRHLGLDGVVRDLQIRMCQDCGGCEVRDRSIDALPDGTAQTPRQMRPQRRDWVIGWYSGGRPRNREYR